MRLQVRAQALEQKLDAQQLWMILPVHGADFLKERIEPCHLFLSEDMVLAQNVTHQFSQRSILKVYRFAAHRLRLPGLFQQLPDIFCPDASDCTSSVECFPAAAAVINFQLLENPRSSRLTNSQLADGCCCIVCHV